MSALIPALISLLMSRMKGGGGGGGGGAPMSDTDKDNKYWDKHLYSADAAEDYAKAREERSRRNSQPLPSFNNRR